MPKRKQQNALKQAVSKKRRAASGQSSSSLAAANPFEVRQNARSKHNIIGRIKGSQRNVGQARAQQQSHRNSTLIREYERRTGANRANEFRDSRIGEAGRSGGSASRLTEDEKALARFQKVRVRQLKKSARFHLGDDDDDTGAGGVMLTHDGKVLGEDDFDMGGEGRGLDSDDDDDDGGGRRNGAKGKGGALSREMVQALHFGQGGGGDGTGHDASGGDGGQATPSKSRREIMEEMIAKSKAYKAERQKDKRTQDETTDKLDSDFASLQELLAPTMRPQKGTKEAEALPKDKLDDFDIATRSFAFEQRARARPLKERC